MEQALKTAAYCRVSTLKEEQEGSYEIQETYYRNLIQSSPDMEFAGIYGDRGRSGMFADKRPGLQKLLEDCRAGKVEQILTKSISRFARNMGECAEMIRELRGIGVNLFFEEQNLDTKDPKGDLVLNIFAAIAQEESRSISEHVKKAHEQYVLEGRPYVRISFGYQNGGNHKWVINEEEATMVRTAFQMADEGRNYEEIRKALNAMGGGKWSQRRLKYMLTNEVYKGDFFSNKTVCLVPGKQVVNKGYTDRIYIEGHHEPIVSADLFDRVQELVESKALYKYQRKADPAKTELEGTEGRSA